MSQKPKCQCYKSQRETNVRCPYDTKENSRYCGVHQKTCHEELIKWREHEIPLRIEPKLQVNMKPPQAILPKQKHVDEHQRMLLAVQKLEKQKKQRQEKEYQFVIKQSLKLQQEKQKKQRQQQLECQQSREIIPIHNSPERKLDVKHVRPVSPKIIDKCQHLLASSDDISVSQDFTIRNIDKLIHQPFKSCQIPCPYSEHIKHQVNILKIVADCEKLIFNDPHVKYPSRRHFSGIFGTMSNIFTSYFFLLYLDLLSKGVQVSADEDCKTLFFLLHSIDMHRLPATELTYIRRIIEHFKRTIDSPFFSTIWWENFLRGMVKLIDEKKRTTFYQNCPEEMRKFDYLRGFVDKYVNEFTKCDTFSYQHYEYVPDYVNDNFTTIDQVIERYTMVMNLFTI